MKDLGINCFHFPKHQISSLSLVPTILALVDRNDESVVILKITIDKVCCALQKKLFTSPSRISILSHKVSSILTATLAAESCILFFPEAPDQKIGPYAIRSFLFLNKLIHAIPFLNAEHNIAKVRFSKFVLKSRLIFLYLRCGPYKAHLYTQGRLYFEEKIAKLRYFCENVSL